MRTHELPRAALHCLLPVDIRLVRTEAELTPTPDHRAVHLGAVEYLATHLERDGFATGSVGAVVAQVARFVLPTYTCTRHGTIARWFKLQCEKIYKTHGRAVANRKVDAYVCDQVCEHGTLCSTICTHAYTVLSERVRSDLDMKRSHGTLCRAVENRT